MDEKLNIGIFTIGEENGYNYILAKIIQSIINKHEIKSEIINIINCLSRMNDYYMYVFILPEWNGSFPGYFKTAIDNSGYPSILKEKHISLFGTSSGPFGNLIGVNHMTYILQHIGSNVQNKKICIYNIKDNINNVEFLNKIENQIIEFLNKKIKL